MTEPYLILHKVRGEPAFDVAIEVEKLSPDSPELWIIPTSGHKAHPYEKWPLSSVANITTPLSLPDNWPDHYHASEPLPPRAARSTVTQAKPKFTSDDL